LPIVGSSLTVLLDDDGQGVFDALVGREPPLAGVTLPPPPRHRASGREPRIDDATFELAAVGTLHGSGSPGRRADVEPGEPLRLERRDYERGVRSPEPEGVGERVPHTSLAGAVRHVVECALGI